MAQEVSAPAGRAVAIVGEYQQAYAAATGKSEFSYLGLEVFINTKVLVDGLLQAGRVVTRETLVVGLETMGPRQFGPMNVVFSPGRHDSSSCVGLTMIHRQGRFFDGAAQG